MFTWSRSSCLFWPNSSADHHVLGATPSRTLVKYLFIIGVYRHLHRICATFISRLSKRILRKNKTSPLLATS